MSRAVRWDKYGPCEECEAPAEQPCRDLRFIANREHTSHVIPATRAHPGRHVKGWLPPEREAAR